MLLAWPVAQAQTVWFTVVGEPANPAVNTVQVDPTPVDSTDTTRTMRVRVNRSEVRTSWDGVPYRSYESDVLFDCRANTARYLAIRYHLEPVWQGQPHRAVAYTTGTPRWMEFRQIEPNPTQRIVGAACGRVR